MLLVMAGPRARSRCMHTLENEGWTKGQEHIGSYLAATRHHHPPECVEKEKCFSIVASTHPPSPSPQIIKLFPIAHLPRPTGWRELDHALRPA